MSIRSCVNSAFFSFEKEEIVTSKARNKSATSFLYGLDTPLARFFFFFEGREIGLRRRGHSCSATIDITYNTYITFSWLFKIIITEKKYIEIDR